MGKLTPAIKGVSLTPLKIIERDKGNIMHGLKNNESSFSAFGEAYFTFVKHQVVKGWKNHTQMTLNLIVPLGEVRFVIFDDRTNSPSNGQFFEVKLSRNNYQRLTIEPGVWFAFQGVGTGENMTLNIGSIRHDPTETIDRSIDFFEFDWSLI